MATKVRSQHPTKSAVTPQPIADIIVCARAPAAPQLCFHRVSSTSCVRAAAAAAGGCPTACHLTLSLISMSLLLLLAVRRSIQYPMMFRITNNKGGINRHTHCSVMEFTAEEGRAYIPHWVSNTHTLTLLLSPTTCSRVYSNKGWALTSALCVVLPTSVCVRVHRR